MQTIFEAESSDAVRLTEYPKRRWVDADHRGDRDGCSHKKERFHEIYSLSIYCVVERQELNCEPAA